MTPPLKTPVWTTPYNPHTTCPGCDKPVQAREVVCFHALGVEEITSETPTDLWHVACVHALELEDLL